MKGIILAGGKGTRLYPSTMSVSKQLLQVYDKPMIFYPLSVLMMAQIKEILVISSPDFINSYKTLLGDGSHLGMKFCYEKQDKPDGIASALKLGETFIGNESVALILGDNIFYGFNFQKFLKNKKNLMKKGATIFGYQVSDPERFGVVSFKDGDVISIEEKPKNPKSNYAVVGLYFYDRNSVEMVKQLKYSARGELEISDLNNLYLEKKQLKVGLLDEGFAWLDTGTPDSLLEAGQFVSTVEKRQGIKIGCIEEVAFKNGWISKKELKKIIDNRYGNNEYGHYLLKIYKK